MGTLAKSGALASGLFGGGAAEGGGGGSSLTPTPVAGGVIATTAGILNTNSSSADTAYTFGAAPADGGVFALAHTNTHATLARQVQFPSSYSQAQGATITAFSVPPLTTVEVMWRRLDGVYRIYGEPAAALATYTWASKPTTGVAGDRIYISDVGGYGTDTESPAAATLTEWVWKTVGGVARWYPAQPIVWSLDVQRVLTASVSEQIARKLTLPAGLLWTGARIVRRASWGKTGGATTTITNGIKDRVGTAGTTADGALQGQSLAMSTAGHQSIGFENEYLVLGPTSLATASGGAGSNSSWSAAGGSGLHSAFTSTIPDHGVNALIWSGSITMTAATDVPHSNTFRLELAAP